MLDVFRKVLKDQRLGCGTKQTFAWLTINVSGRAKNTYKTQWVTIKYQAVQYNAGIPKQFI